MTKTGDIKKLISQLITKFKTIHILNAGGRSTVYAKTTIGQIINISSEAAVQPGAFIPHYNAAKAAINSFIKTLSKTYRKRWYLN